jgi:hypothetical protein
MVLQMKLCKLKIGVESIRFIRWMGDNESNVQDFIYKAPELPTHYVTRISFSRPGGSLHVTLRLDINGVGVVTVEQGAYLLLIGGSLCVLPKRAFDHLFTEVRQHVA